MKILKLLSRLEGNQPISARFITTEKKGKWKSRFEENNSMEKYKSLKIPREKNEILLVTQIKNYIANN